VLKQRQSQPWAGWAEHGNSQMKALSHERASSPWTLLSWSADLVSRAVASAKPKYRAGQIAAVVAESGNPQGV